MNTARTKAVRGRLRAIEGFLRDWDPIGVITSPDDRFGEYDVYAPAILGKLQSGIDTDALEKYLHVLATQQMGLAGDVTRERDFARKLVAWWANAYDKGECCKAFEKRGGETP